MRRSIVDETLDPYFLHHFDSTGMTLVTKVMDGDNYNSWSHSMKIALSVKNKFGFIDGTILKPDGSDVNRLTAWKRNNYMVISWILDLVSQEISSSVQYGESAKEIWEDLEERFQQSNGPRIFQLRRDIMNLIQDQNTVSVYFTKLKTLYEELNNFKPTYACTCGGSKALFDFIQSEYIMKFILGLNESFTTVCGQVLMMDHLPPISEVFAIVLQ